MEYMVIRERGELGFAGTGVADTLVCAQEGVQLAVLGEAGQERAKDGGIFDLGAFNVSCERDNKTSCPAPPLRSLARVMAGNQA